MSYSDWHKPVTWHLTIQSIPNGLPIFKSWTLNAGQTYFSVQLFGHIYRTVRWFLPHLVDWLYVFSRAVAKMNKEIKLQRTIIPELRLIENGMTLIPFQKIWVKREEGIQRVCVSGHRVAAHWTPHHWQRAPVIPLNDGVTEHELVLPANRRVKLPSCVMLLFHKALLSDERSLSCCTWWWLQTCWWQQVDRPSEGWAGTSLYAQDSNPEDTPTLQEESKKKKSS